MTKEWRVVLTCQVGSALTEEQMERVVLALPGFGIFEEDVKTDSLRAEFDATGESEAFVAVQAKGTFLRAVEGVVAGPFRNMTVEASRTS